MIKIGIIGDTSHDILECLYRIFAKFHNPYAKIVIADVNSVLYPQKYDIIVMNDFAVAFSNRLSKVDIKTKITILNADSGLASFVLKSIKNPKIHWGKIITYGLNAKSCITASSIKEDSILICIQRAISTINGDLLREQEFLADFKELADFGESAGMGALSCAMICGMNPKNFAD